MLSTAVVGVLDAEGAAVTRFFNATERSMLELEFRLTESASGRPLLLVRDEVNSANLIGGMWRAADHMTSMLSTPAAPCYSRRGSGISLDAYDMPEPENKRHDLERYANPREVVLEALRNSGMFEQVVENSSEAEYGLDVDVVQADFVGAYQTTANVSAHYRLTNRETGNTLSWEDLGTSATLSASDIRNGTKRLEAVVPAAFRNNIDLFLMRLDARLSEAD